MPLNNCTNTSGLNSLSKRSEYLDVRNKQINKTNDMLLTSKKHTQHKGMKKKVESKTRIS